VHPECNNLMALFDMPCAKHLVTVAASLRSPGRGGVVRVTNARAAGGIAGLLVATATRRTVAPRGHNCLILRFPRAPKLAVRRRDPTTLAAQRHANCSTSQA
jgi:hypothetical protein